uniref:SAM domain-containing protein n=1 Tax=Necator americanus TaxID=51031 RepID=W2TEJ8_NECAM|nr:hypothetical protein NECAME_09830 [Necator americanus]ETN79427.1 hypothetical protein NECAME_09830 [Necator americanus]
MTNSYYILKSQEGGELRPRLNDKTEMLSSFQDVYQCASLEHRVDVQSILNTDDDDVAVIYVKYKWRTSADHVVMRVPVCKTARQASGWLRVLLRSLGCCPYLFSFEKTPKCGCNKIFLEERRKMAESPAEFVKKADHFNTLEKRRRRCPKVGSSKRRRTQQPSPLPKELDNHSTRNALTSDDDFSRSSIDEMPLLHPADSTGFVPNGSTNGEETSNQCSSSDEVHFNGIPTNNTSPQRPLRIDGDAKEWDAKQLLGFLRTTFPDLSDVTSVLERENIDGAKLLTMSQQDCIDSLGLNLGPALRLYEVIQVGDEKRKRKPYLTDPESIISIIGLLIPSYDFIGSAFCSFVDHPQEDHFYL